MVSWYSTCWSYDYHVHVWSLRQIRHGLSSGPSAVVLTAQETATISVPLKNKKSRRGYTMHPMGVIDPVSVISYLFNEVGVSIPENMVAQYWNHYRSEPVSAQWALCHPARSDAIPLGLYGDSCKVRQGSKMVGIYLNLPLFRPKSIRSSRFLLVAVQEEMMFKRKTLDAIYRFLVWRLNLLHDGKYPHTNINGGPLQGSELQHAGKEIVHNKTFAVCELRGDWVWLKDCLSLRSSWKGGTVLPVCFKCEARSIEPHLYYNVERQSNVWSTEYSTLADFLVHQMPAEPSDFAELAFLDLFGLCHLYVNDYY